MKYQEADLNHEQTIQDLRAACEGNDAFRADLLDYLHFGEADLRICLQEATPNIVLLRRLLEAGKDPWIFTHDTDSNMSSVDTFKLVVDYGGFDVKAEVHLILQ